VKNASDIELFNNIQKHHKPAFDELFRRYYSPLCRFALKITNSEEKSEEAVQEFFVRLWEHRNNLLISQSVASYLFKSVRLKVYEQFRSEQIKEKHEETFAQNLSFIDEDDNNEFDSYQLACLIWGAVDQLPEKCRQIFKLSRDEGLTYNEIAEHLGISAKTVENQMGIAFKKLREILYPELKAKGWDSLKIVLFLLLVFSLINADLIAELR
jgi:RNA polymerase sigma-70 factor (ECF subfamily)